MKKYLYLFPLALAIASCGGGADDNGGADASDTTVYNKGYEEETEADANANSFGDEVLPDNALPIAMFKELLEVGGEDEKELIVAGTIKTAGNTILIEDAMGGSMELTTKEFTVPESAVGRDAEIKVVARRTDGDNFNFEAAGILLL